jgi:hypothetical protein
VHSRYPAFGEYAEGLFEADFFEGHRNAQRAREEILRAIPLAKRTLTRWSA